MALGDGFALFDQKMHALRSSDEDLEGIWDIINQLLPILIPLIGGCFASGRANHKPIKFINRSVLAARVQRTTGCTWANAYKASDYCFKILDGCELKEFQLFVSDCCASG